MFVQHNGKQLGSKYAASILGEYPIIGGVVTHLFLVACRIPIAAESTNSPIPTCAIDGVELRLKEKVYQEVSIDCTCTL